MDLKSAFRQESRQREQGALMLYLQRLEGFAELFNQCTLRAGARAAYRWGIGNTFAQTLKEDRRVYRLCFLHRRHFALCVS